MSRLLLLIFLTLPLYCSSQIITTIAGNGTNSNTGDGGPSINAGIYNPTWGIFDSNGNYYVASVLGHKIRKIAPTGIITTIAGTGTQGYNGDGGLADTSKLWQPGGITTDSLNNLFIADSKNNRIRKVNVGTGIITTVAGIGMQGFGGDNGPATLASLSSPNDICFDKFGNLYISDPGNFRIRKITPSGLISTVVGTGTAGYNGDNILGNSAQIYGTRGLATDSMGNLFIAENDGGRVRKLDITTGMITTIAGTGSVPNYNGDNILATAANINPVRVAFDRYGYLYITDNSNNRIRKIDESGIIHTVVGNGNMGYAGDGGLATLAQLNSPSGITFDSCNNLYITEVNQGRIRKVTFNDTCGQTSTSTITSKGQEFNIYPNPANTHLTITGENLQSITITNTLGQIAHSQKAAQEKTLLDISALNAGVYFVTVADKQDVKVTKKVVKE